MNINFTDDNGVQRNISDEITIDTKTFEVVDIYENSVRALDCMYRLTTECDYYENDLPITFKLPSEDKFDLFVKFLIQNVKKVGDTFTNDLTDELITSVVNSNAFGEYKGLVLQTIGNLHLYKKIYKMINHTHWIISLDWLNVEVILIFNLKTLEAQLQSSKYKIRKNNSKYRIF